MSVKPKILIIRLSSIGDIIHTLTILSDIRASIPTAEIDWLVDDSFYGVAELSPLIDNIISIPLRAWKKNKFLWLPNLFRFKQKLVFKSYDYIIDTQGLLKSAFLAKFLFTGQVYGLDRASAREGLASFFYTKTYRVAQNNIAVIRLRSLAAKIFALKIDLTKVELQIKANNFHLTTSNGYVIFLHGTSKANKKWPMENWLSLANWILLERKQDIVISYSNSSEQKFAEEFTAKLSNSRVKLVDKLNFSDLSGLISRADLVVGVDTGFTHLANLLNVATLAIYLNSNPAYVGLLESSQAKNFGGMNNTKVAPQELIKFIQQHSLLR